MTGSDARLNRLADLVTHTVGALVTGLGLAACSVAPSGGCLADDECDDGQICFEEACATVCFDRFDCPASAACREGVCVEGDAPPDDPCAGVVCYDIAGGCGINGRCISEAPAGCEYDNAAEHTACDLPGGAGFCVAGACVECDADIPCAAPSSFPVCFDTACIDGICQHTPHPAEVCRPPGCYDGYVSSERVCGAVGACPPAVGSQWCDGYACDSTHTACLVGPCGSDADCVPEYYCAGLATGGGACQPRVADGGDCTDDGAAACTSGYCDGSLCCSGGDCCVTAGDCPVSYTLGSVCALMSPATTCQGSAATAECAANVCATTIVDDDSGCAGEVRACPDAQETCSSAVDQPVASCATACAAVETACQDLLDDDCDGLLDCNDGNCSTVFPCTCAPTGASEAECGDGADDDCNGLTDCDDPACFGRACRASATACDVAESCPALGGSCPADDVQPPSCDCALPWGGTLAHGASVSAYAAAGVACGASCSGETRQCSGGVLSGSYANPSCSVTPCPCSLPWGGTLAHGASVTAYAASSVACGVACSSEPRVCTDGVLSGSFTSASCSVGVCDCTLPWGGTLAHGASVVAYAAASVGCGGTCSGETRTCSNGVLSGTAGASSCSVDACPFCWGNSCSGGAITDVGGYRIHTFTGSGTFTVTGVAGNVEVLVVGGGGGGAADWNGGGGGGGVTYRASLAVGAGGTAVIVGAGGLGHNGAGFGPNGDNGGDSAFGGLSAPGGGGGAGENLAHAGGSAGGSGGGGGWYRPAGGAAVGENTHAGGGGVYSPSGGGGGGGAGTAGANAWSDSAGDACTGPDNNGWNTHGGNGGAGYTSSISGAAVTYAGGGGGGGDRGALGGAGGGGNGCGQCGPGGSVDGAPNSGGGGGGTTYDVFCPGFGDGGSGIVIVRYPH